MEVELFIQPTIYRVNEQKCDCNCNAPHCKISGERAHPQFDGLRMISFKDKWQHGIFMLLPKLRN